MENPIVSGWSDFFVAAAGAAAALAGLVFVSISINLSRIIEARGVSGRAAETMVLLSGALASSLITLFPHISALHLGLSLLLTTVPTWVLPMFIQWRSLQRHTYLNPAQAAFRTGLSQAATLPGVWSALALCGLLPGGLAPLAVAIILSMLVAILNAWVLLIEILR
ncbi:MAG TPA: hypothetical protein VN693_03025 [Rhodanobacteraceae bacterium]|nr:hypothetical protein [Rhodanobacteraceae bacterium]